MMEQLPDWMRAIEQTYVAKFPQQHLATFGATNISYFVVTEPIYTAIDSNKKDLEGVLRKGRVIAEKPTLITPTYAMNLDGFSESAYDYMRHAAQVYGSNSPGILYQYRNEPENLEILSGIPSEIAARITSDLNAKNDDLSVVIVGVDEFWDVALLKFIYEYTASSVSFNTDQFRSKGLLDPQPSAGGVPRVVVDQIEEMFKSVQKGGSPEVLKKELDKWGVYSYFEDRFLQLFR